MRRITAVAADHCRAPQWRELGGCARCLERFGAAQLAAGKAVQRAVREGILPPATELICVDCGKAAAEYEHRDYSRPMFVEPVCRSCNQRRGSAVFTCDPPASEAALRPPAGFKHAYRNFYVVGKDGKLRLLYPTKGEDSPNGGTSLPA